MSGPGYFSVLAATQTRAEEEADLDPLVEKRYRRAPAFRPEPDRQQISAALEMLRQAERPMIVAGGGVIRSGAQAELLKLA